MQLKTFDPTVVTNIDSIAIIGKRGVGKTGLVVDLLHSMKCPNVQM